MKEVKWDQEIESAEFVFSREFMVMRHNYLCAICKENKAIQEVFNGILQPCWDCQKDYRVVKLNWFDKLLGRK